MADTKVSALTELAAAPAADDELLVVDKSDTTMAASGTDKRMRYDRISGLWVPQSLIDAKGDLIAGSAADTAARVAVGSNDAALVADSAQTAGVRWQGADAAAATPSTRSLGTTSTKAAAGDATEYAFSTYKNILTRPSGGVIGSAVVASTFLNNQLGTWVAVGAAGSAHAAFYLNPTDFAAGTRTTYLRLRAWVITNAVAPAITFTFHLYPVATWGGASGAQPSVASVGASLGNVAIASPGASAPTTAVSSDITFPSAGWHVISLVTSGTTATNSLENTGFQLQMRQV